MAKSPTKAGAARERELAVEIANRIRETVEESDHVRALLDWLDDAMAIRGAVKKCRRVFGERERLARRESTHPVGEQIASATFQYARTGALAASGNSTPDREDTAAISAALVAHARINQNRVVVGSESTDTALRVGLIQWYATAFAYAHRRGRQISPDDIIGVYGVGKTHAPRRVATLALAELGLSTAEIHRALQSRRDNGDLVDRATVRRLLHAAKS